MMKKVITYALCLILGVCASVRAAGDDHLGPSQMESDIAALINFARFDPQTVGDYLGVDGTSLFSGIEVHEPFWSTHKWRLSFNSELSSSAVFHCRDMLQRDFFASVTPEGRAPEQRAVDQGYRPGQLEEYISVFAMANYIQPEEALFELFKRFFIDEVESYKTGKANIFDYHIKDLGVAFQSGKLTLGGKATNVYVLLVTYGVSEDALIEESLMRSINEARNDHSFALEFFGIDKKQAAKALDGFVLINLNGGLSPLVFYSSISGSQLKLQQKDNVGYDNGYKEIATLDWEVNVPKEFDPNDIALILFEKLLHMENMEGVQAVFDFRANVGLIKLERMDADESTSQYKVVFTIATLNSPLSLFMGNVLAGEDSGNSFFRGSGCKDIYLILYNEQGTAISSFITGMDGSFRLSQESGSNNWEAWSGETLLATGKYETGYQSYWQNIFVSNN